MKRVIPYFFLFAACNSPVFCQQGKIDSIRLLLSADKEDTLKVNHLISLFRVHR